MNQCHQFLCVACLLMLQGCTQDQSGATSSPDASPNPIADMAMASQDMDVGTPEPDVDVPSEDMDVPDSEQDADPPMADATVDAMRPVEDTGVACEAPVGNFDNTENRDITFLAFGDTQITLVGTPGCKQYDGYRADQQQRMIAALNGIANETWPDDERFHRHGRPISRIRGVLVAGDITENGNGPLVEGQVGHVPGMTCDEFTPFEEAYGVCGERQLNYPVYEGYGNHDFPYLSQADSDYHPVISLIGARTAHRANVVHSAPIEDAHYAWKWDDIHFVNLNVKPSGEGNNPAHRQKTKTVDSNISDQGVPITRTVNPHFALDYLDDYLSSDAVEAGAQVVIMTHYGPTKPSRFPEEERNALCQVLENHREDDKKVVAWIHGHSHKSDFYYWDCPDEYRVSRIPIFNVGSPFYAKTEDVEGDPDDIEEFLVEDDDDRYYVNGRSVHFTLFRLGNRTLEAMDVSALPGPDGQPVFQMSGIGTPNFDDDDDENPDGLYGGWIKVIEDHLNPPRE